MKKSSRSRASTKAQHPLPTFPMKPLAVLIAMYCSGAAAADSTVAADNIEEIVVTGLRQSLVTNETIKRDSSGIVDAITAEDIGKFPDTNLAESIQRIPGVTIDRVNDEGSRVTVRGFGPEFNLVTLNGRSMPANIGPNTANASRSFDFENLSADGIKGIEVYKTGRADVPSGGIGSTINITTARPFDFNGMRAHVFGQGRLRQVDPSWQQGHAGFLRLVQRYLLRRSGGFPDQRVLLQAQQPGAEREHQRLAAKPVRSGRSPGHELQHES